jgi:hypothetical protein
LCSAEPFDDFFFEKKKQKTFAPSPSPPDAWFFTLRGTKRAKVFWFFFSKKNILPLPAFP